MTLTIEIGKNRTVGITPEQLTALRGHEVVANKIFAIGLKNILSDANAGIGKRETFKSDAEFGEAAYSASMKKLDAMLRGEYRGAVERGPRIPADPVAAEAMREARVFVYGKAKGWEKDAPAAIKFIGAAAGALDMAIAEGENDKDFYKKVIAAAIAKRAAREDVIAAAKAVVAARGNLAVESAEDLGL